MKLFSLYLQKVKKKVFCFISLFILALLACTLLFRVVPIPFSAYMVEQRVSYWLQGDFSYSAKYQWVSLDKINWSIQLAVIAAEDQKFESHYGFDWQAIRSAVKFNQKSKHTRGASTISQQTVKNLYLWHEQSYLRKGLEIPLTLMLETLWSKERILEVYLNIAQFGKGIFGVEAASQYYFKKPAAKLTQSEAALLAAILPNPILYKADKPSPYVLKRQRWIMQQMNQLGRDYLQKM